ncbi:lactam utilization protein LamB [Niastella koreensis]|uniref:LamB/YcsF family protein n=2 Tax=Niastella koreensis TaxID=354356 RepID=G8T834_NIAKG|nr:5-oxoprolinase subunit PxpA [Niastella koreensis]AEV97985.1 LamB/YcsF family protein [Niastella koreensis GR20-10]OQP40216.1 lactam utilization protein LamB [Niastella koreensis]
MLSIDINCDMGESTHLWPYDIEKDKLLLSYVSSINLACGYHAGDAHTMYALAEAALGSGVAIGAHPGFPDRDNFGRTNMDLSPSAIYELMIYQLGALDAFLRVLHTRLHHVKPHGALYNMAAKDEVMAEMICKAVYDYDPHLVLYGLSGSKLIKAATATGLKTRSEVFADRTYQDDGHLTPRTHAQALLSSTEQSLQQVLQMVQTQSVTSLNGKTVPIVAETVCVHSDSLHALSFVREVRGMLEASGIKVAG